MTDRDIMVRNDAGQFEEIEQDALADELIAERYGYTTEEIEDMIEQYEKDATGGIFGRLFGRWG
ncbi:hypothetical protein HVTV-2_gp152 [Haloarcula virus HVTV-2]|uniref:Uncharacterized protein n=1 Tax=Haloarcula vallismortis tailed virus 1 TaxID=1262528 RepID=L7TH24_9CAUD|nr:hypothetical protein HVTV1_150 [Haloarcula vallismortis tailed virus 1]AGC34519.1 hypothetical protein HVTV1_150 [Haloarcula vallismortis tailed virus 1]UBF22959.1 hypothetical protein HVTV-2_gp152 [Haloarcula virus HVTV-2]